jgi:heat shock protein HslJ
VLPCADCAGIAVTLTLREDGLYRLRRTYLGKPGAPFNEVGRWAAETSSGRLMLRSGSQRTVFELPDAATLRQLDTKGQAISSDHSHDLRRTAEVDVIDESLPWRGEVLVQGAAATVTDCSSDLRWPVVPGGDFKTLERNTLRLRSAAGTPLVVRFEGRLVMLPGADGAPAEQMVVDRFVGAQPGAVCDSTLSGTGDGGDQVVVTLQNTYWKLVELGGSPVAMLPGQQREQRITLAADGKRLLGFSGCNSLVGSYQQDGTALRLGPLAATRMACAEPVMSAESRLLAALSATTGYRIEGQHLLLLGADGALARWEAVTLR